MVQDYDAPYYAPYELPLTRQNKYNQNEIYEREYNALIAQCNTMRLKIIDNMQNININDFAGDGEIYMNTMNSTHYDINNEEVKNEVDDEVDDEVEDEVNDEVEDEVDDDDVDHMITE